MENIDYKNFSEKELRKKLQKLQKLYTNDESPLTDDEFDYLKEYYEDKFKTIFSQIGAEPTSARKKIKLPYPMASQNKIKGKNAAKDLENWKNKNSGSFTLESKIDGVSLLYVSNNRGRKLYTRGDGEYGEDKTYLLEYLNLPIPDYPIVVRGELALNTNIFEEYVKEKREEGTKRKLNKSRNVVTGLVNAKDSLDIDLLRKLTFYAFQLIDFDDLTGKGQIKKLKKIGFTVPWNVTFKYEKDLNVENLTSFLLEKRGIEEGEISPVDIDGLIIVSNSSYEEPKDENPSNQIAFKIDTLKEAEVVNIEWSSRSKTGKLTPVIIIKPVELLGSDIEHISGHNARYIFDRNIGIGSKLLITLGGDIIPTVVEVLEESSNLVYPTINNYKWDSNKVEFILDDPSLSEEVQKAKVDYFVKHLEIKSLGEKTIDTLFEGGFNSLKKILQMSPEDIHELDRLGQKSAIKICTSIRDSITNIKLYKIMAASTMFEDGFGNKRINEILEELKIDTLLKLKEFSKNDEDDNIEAIKEIKGFAEITSRQFVENLPKFLKWLKKHDEITIAESEIKKEKSGKYLGKIIVLSDLKNKKDVGNRLSDLGAEIKDNVTKKVNLLIVGTEEETNKVKLAKKYGIEIINLKNLVF